MNFKIRPLLIAAAASLVMQWVVMYIDNTASSIPFVGQPPTPDSSPSEIISAGIIVISFACLERFLMYGLAGGLYSFLGVREDPLSIRAGAIGGAAATALGCLIGSPVNFLVASGLLHPLFTGEQGRPFEELYPGITIEQAIILTPCWIVIGMLVAAVPGAVGGAVAAAIARRKTEP